MINSLIDNLLSIRLDGGFPHFGEGVDLEEGSVRADEETGTCNKPIKSVRRNNRNSINHFKHEIKIFLHRIIPGTGKGR